MAAGGRPAVHAALREPLAGHRLHAPPAVRHPERRAVRRAVDRGRRPTTRGRTACTRRRCGSRTAWCTSRTGPAGASSVARLARGRGPPDEHGSVRRPRLGVLGQPGLRDPLLGPRQPGLGDQVAELVAVHPPEVRDPQQHRRVAVEVRRREEQAARVGEQQLLLAEVRDPEHEDVVEPLPGLGVDRVGPLRAVAQEELAVHQVGGRPLAILPARRLGHRQSQLIEIGHRRHGREPSRRRAAGRPSGRRAGRRRRPSGTRRRASRRGRRGSSRRSSAARR